MVDYQQDYSNHYPIPNYQKANHQKEDSLEDLLHHQKSALEFLSQLQFQVYILFSLCQKVSQKVNSFQLQHISKLSTFLKVHLPYYIFVQKIYYNLYQNYNLLIYFLVQLYLFRYRHLLNSLLYDNYRYDMGLHQLYSIYLLDLGLYFRI